MAKKISQTVPWLTHLLNALLPPIKMQGRDQAVLQGCTVKIVDGTNIKQQGEKGEVIRAHMCYDLSHRRMEEVHVTDQHTAESLAVFTISPGCIYIGDAGYGKGKNYEYIVSGHADALLRVTPGQILLSQSPEGRQKIEMAHKLKTKKDMVEFSCYVHTEKRKYMPVRIIACRLPPDKAKQAIKRKKRDASKKQYELTEETLLYAQWMIVMTSLGEAYSAEKIVWLYRLRWQIELVFKRIKQYFKVTRLKAASLRHSTAIVLLMLIVWALTEREVVWAEMYLQSKQADMSRYSVWSMSGYYFHSLKATITRLLALCTDAAIDFLHVFHRLRNHKSSRHNQFASLLFDSPC